jgi:hypothetical protein
LAARCGFGFKRIRFAVIKRLGDGVAFGIDSAQELDFALGRFEQSLTTFEMPYAVFIPRESFRQTELATLQLGDDLLQFAK